MMDETSIPMRRERPVPPKAGALVVQAQKPTRPLLRVAGAVAVGFGLAVIVPARLHAWAAGALLRVGIVRYFRRSMRSAS